MKRPDEIGVPLPRSPATIELHISEESDFKRKPRTPPSPVKQSPLSPPSNRVAANGTDIASEVDSLSRGVENVANVIKQRTAPATESKLVKSPDPPPSYASLGDGNRQQPPESLNFPSVRKTRQQLLSRDNYASEGGGAALNPAALKQPYHTMEDSKPFSYIPALNGGSRPGSRGSQQPQLRGLESPSLLRKIMGKDAGDGDDATTDAGSQAAEDAGVDRREDFSKESTPTPKFTTTITIQNGGGPAAPQTDIASNLPGPSPEEMKRQLAELQQQQHKLLLEQQQQLLQKQQQLLQQQAKLQHQEQQQQQMSTQTTTVTAMVASPQSLPTPTYTNYLLSKPGESDEEASLTWLERQQKKLKERRECERRRTSRNNANGSSVMHELKSSLKAARGVSGETDGYASSEAAHSQLYSEASSTRESSPHLGNKAATTAETQTPQPPVSLDDMSTETLENLYKHMMSMQQQSSTTVAMTEQQQQQVPLQTSTPKYLQPQTSYSSSLSRQMSETSYDRQRPFTTNRRLRYDSAESETELGSFYYAGAGGNVHQAMPGQRLYGSNTSLNSSNYLGAGFAGGPGSFSLPGSRPITPAFPQMTLTSAGRGQAIYHRTAALNNSNNNSGRAGSPGSGSLYQGAPASYLSSRRGSVSSEPPADVAPQYVKLAKDNYKFWYKPNITREEAIAVLRHCPPGTFVVRDSNSFPGAFGLALKVATPPANAKAGDETDLVRHFLIEPTKKGVKLKGYSNEPVFASLSALVYQHTTTQLALPVRLALPTRDLLGDGDLGGGEGGSRDSVDSGRASTSSQMQQLLKLGAACNVLYLFSMDVDTLTGPQALQKAIGHLMASKSVFRPVLVHFKVASQGITLTDTARKVFFRKHYNTPAISFCGLDPDDRRWKTRDTGAEDHMFGFVAKKPKSRSHNQCHVFAEHDPEQPARAVVNFVNKVLLQTNGGNGAGGGANGRADIV